MQQGQSSEAALARTLLTAHAVRERAHELLALGEADALRHWRVDRAKLESVAAYVVETMRRNYPALDIPFHARWRHFASGGTDRWAKLEATAPWPDASSRARSAFDLAIVSVLLDAGAGPDWRYRGDEGAALSRSEGLAVASFDMFAQGAFSADPREKLRADASRLAAIDASKLARGFQVSATNGLVGLEGRAALLRALGRAVSSAPGIFAKQDDPRPGGLFDHLAEMGRSRRVLAATSILEAVLTHLGPIWPSRLSLGGLPLGDCWHHPAIMRTDATNGLLPFHKLSQWLSYSLIEPLQKAGIEIVDIDGLTGLPDYRNGGLFIDLGAVSLKDIEEISKPHETGSELVVEWRALTVALLDETAKLIRRTLRLDATTLPLAKVLEGGTWPAGRRIARERRGDGSPPLTIVSDGTVF
jgi:hypothetical protein